MSKRKNNKYERLGRSVPFNRGGLNNYFKPTHPASKYNQSVQDAFADVFGDKSIYPGSPYGWSFNRHSGNSDSWLAALRSLGYNDDAATNLFNMLQGYLGHSGETTERNDMFYQYLLQLISNKDQRAYDEKALEEQRKYDRSQLEDQRKYDRSQLEDSRNYNDPFNQLARLTGAGIGRDAALQILSGSAGGAGVGSSVMPSSANTIGSQGSSAPGVSAPSGTMAVNIANTAIAALQSLVNSGVSLAQGISQVQAQQNANYWNQQQISANESVTALATAIQSLQDQGIIESSQIESLSNSNDLIKYLHSISKDNDQVSQLLDSNAFKSALGTPFGRQRFNDYWKSLRDSRDSGTLYDEFIKQQRLNNYLTEANISKVGSELALIDAQTNSEYQSLIESATRIASMEADIEVKNAQGDWIRIETDNYQRLADAQYNQIVAQTEGTQIQNNINRDLFELNHAGFPMLKQVYLDELNDKVAYWSTINDPEVRQNKINHWLLDERNAYKAAYLENLRLQAVGSFANDHPDTWRLIQAWNYVGAGDAVRTGLKVGADALGAAKFAL